MRTSRKILFVVLLPVIIPYLIIVLFIRLLAVLGEQLFGGKR